MLDKALATGDALAPGDRGGGGRRGRARRQDAAPRWGTINQDLSLLADVFGSLDESRREELLKQLRYSAELVAFLEGM